MARWVRASRSRRSVVTLAAVAVLATGCQGSASQAGGSPGVVVGGSGGNLATPSSSPTATADVVQLTLNPSDKSTGVAPDTLVSVKATHGSLISVTVKDAKGVTVSGALSHSTSWKARDLLRPATTYVVTTVARSTDGTSTTTSSSFTTLRPAVTATYQVMPGTGESVGVGMPVIVQFDSAVTTKAYRAAVERRVKVTSSPAQRGSWGWLDNRQLMWRPATYWKAGTKVNLVADIHGVQTGTAKYVGDDAAARFSIGSSMVSTVNIQTHQMTVKRDGRLVRTIPVSTGRPGLTTETRSGTKVIMSRSPEVVMDSATIGIPKGSLGYYHIVAKYAMRVTWTGEYLHSAPWSVGAQGFANVSHGCTNLSPDNAYWMYTHSKVGDVVNFTGSNRIFQPGEGIGVWTYSYSQWKAQSALSTSGA